MRKILVAIFLFSIFLFNGGKAYALGECGLSCCIAGSTASGVTLAGKFGLSVMYEYSYMETIRNGTDEVSPDEAIARNKTGASYSVPTEMKMQKYTLVGFVPINERLSVLTYIPYVINDMDMRMSMTMGMMTTVSDMSMDTVQGLGDITVMGLYTLYTDAPVRPTSRLTAGFGVKTPTGETSEKTSSGRLVHAMMQPGTGSWDPLLLVNYMKAYYPLVLQANFLYQMATEGFNGYEYGDRFSLDLAARYQATNYINIGVDLNALHTEKDEDHDGKYSRPATSMIDNVENTGLDSIFLSPVVQAKIPNTDGSAEFKYQFPIYQDMNGFQQVVDWRVLASLSWAF